MTEKQNQQETAKKVTTANLEQKRQIALDWLRRHFKSLDIDETFIFIDF